jgi:hypothetical protein
MRDEKFVKFWSFIRCGDGEASLSAAVTRMKRPAWAPVIAGAIMVCNLSRTLSRIYKIRSIRPGTIRVLDYLCRTILHRRRNQANGVVKFPWTNGSTFLLMNNVILQTADWDTRRQGAHGTYRSAEVQAEVYSITPLNPYPLRGRPGG